MMTIVSCVAAMMPVLSAAPYPRFSGCRSTRAPAWSAASAVRSSEPSSTTMISCVIPCAHKTRRIVSTCDPTAVSSLYAGTITEIAVGEVPGWPLSLCYSSLPASSLESANRHMLTGSW